MDKRHGHGWLTQPAMRLRDKNRQIPSEEDGCVCVCVSCLCCGDGAIHTHPQAPEGVRLGLVAMEVFGSTYPV